jgi:hypothetical protein
VAAVAAVPMQVLAVAAEALFIELLSLLQRDKF